MSNRYSVTVNGVKKVKDYNYACFSAVPSIRDGEDASIFYHITRHKGCDEANKWYLNFVKRLFPFEVLKESDDELLVELKLGTERAENLTKLTFLRYLDKRESDSNTNVRTILEGAFKIKTEFNISSLHSVILAHLTTDCEHSPGHFLMPTKYILENVSESSNYYDYSLKTLPTIKQLQENLTDQKLPRVFDKMGVEKIPEDKTKEYISELSLDLRKGYKMLLAHKNA